MTEAHRTVATPAAEGQSTSTRTAIGRRYVQEVLDRKTGELVSVDQGDWITIRELAELFGLGPRHTTAVLRHLDFLQVEGGGKDSRHRICNWVVKSGWGKRLHRKSDKWPFDVISPEGVRWITQRWDKALDELERKTRGPIAEARKALEHFQNIGQRKKMATHMQVCWLADFFPHFTHDQIAQCLSVSRQLVDRYMTTRAVQIKRAALSKALFRQ